MKPCTSHKIKLVSDSELILAVNAATFTQNQAKQVGQYLARRYDRKNVEIRPVFVLTPDYTTRPRTWFEELVPTLHEQAALQIRAALSGCSVLQGEPEILVEARPGLPAAAECLAAFALSTKATTIIVPRGERRYLNKMVLSGFTSALRQHTAVDIETVDTFEAIDAPTETVLWLTCPR